MRTTHFLPLLLSLLACTATAQHTGRIVDEAGKPVPHANIVLLSLPDSAYVSGITSRTDGTFSLSTEGRKALLRVSLIGYSTVYRPVSGHKNTLGDLRITPETVEKSLGEATVTAKRPVAKMVDGSLVTSIEGTTLARSGTAEDVLSHVPGIIKKDDKYEVLGKGQPVIYINGRLMRDENELAQLKSDEIKSVEILNNPGARYDATTSAVVRIRTIRRQGEGFGVDATTQYTQGKYAQQNAQFKTNYRHNTLDVFFGADYWGGRTLWNSEMIQENRVDTVWRQALSEQNTSEYHSYAITLGFNKDIADRHSFGLKYQLTDGFHFKSHGDLTSDITADGLYYDRLNNNFSLHADNNLRHALNTYYSGRIGKGELKVDADYYSSGQLTAQTTEEHSASHENRTVASENDVDNRLIAAKADYTLPLWNGRLSTGSHYTYTDRHDDYIIPVNNFGVATSRSRLKEQNTAAYVEYSRPIKKVQLTAGLRYEHVTFNYYADGIYQPGQSRTFDNLFPNVSVATQLGKAQIMAAYKAKTRRPAYGELSNNTTYGNRFTLQSGNPHLKASITHDITLTGVWQWLQAVAVWKQKKNAIINWGTPLKNRPSATLISRTNDDLSSLAVALTAAPKVGIWQPSATVTVFRQWFSKTVMGEMRRFDRPMFTGALYNAFTLPHGWLLNVDYNYQSRGDYQNVYLYKNMHILNVSLHKSFLKDALSLKISGKDLLKDTSSNAHLYMQNSTFIQTGSSDSRLFSVTLRYKFNATRSKYRGQGAAEGEKNRL